MKKPYDAPSRKLIEIGPPDWTVYLGTPLVESRPVTAIDSNLSTVTAEADKVLWIDAPNPGSSTPSSRRDGTIGSTIGRICQKGRTEGRMEGRVEERVEGAVDEAKKILLRQGAKKLGPPDARVEAEIATLDDLDRLNDLIDRVLDVSTWDELMASPDR